MSVHGVRSRFFQDVADARLEREVCAVERHPHPTAPNVVVLRVLLNLGRRGLRQHHPNVVLHHRALGDGARALVRPPAVVLARRLALLPVELLPIDVRARRPRVPQETRVHAVCGRRPRTHGAPPVDLLVVGPRQREVEVDAEGDGEVDEAILFAHAVKHVAHVLHRHPPGGAQQLHRGGAEDTVDEVPALRLVAGAHRVPAVVPVGVVVHTVVEGEDEGAPREVVRGAVAVARELLRGRHVAEHGDSVVRVRHSELVRRRRIDG
mmetsp:Transcript_10502/g.24678  ORF Transcript_10502/g.24678 Transcript_10502/m.24678 type:complete len:265 (-) Transcript_10502:514-1308(-)